MSTLDRGEIHSIVGGDAGDFFRDRPSPDAAILKVRVRTGRFVDAIGLLYTDGTETYHGGTGGDPASLTLDVEQGEFITEVSGRHGQFIDAIHVRTNLRPKGFGGGGEGGAPFAFRAPPGQQIIGFWGRAGHLIDALGILLAPAPHRRTG